MSDGGVPRLYRAAVSIEDTESLEKPVRLAAGIVSRVIPDGRARSALSGRWLGHALHPMLTDFPLGSWMSASLLDLIGGRSSRTASRRLVAVGVAAAVPTIASGWNDWLTASARERRVAVECQAPGCQAESMDELDENGDSAALARWQDRLNAYLGRQGVWRTFGRAVSRIRRGRISIARWWDI